MHSELNYDKVISIRIRSETGPEKNCEIPFVRVACICLFLFYTCRIAKQNTRVDVSGNKKWHRHEFYASSRVCCALLDFCLSCIMRIIITSKKFILRLSTSFEVFDFYSWFFIPDEIVIPDRAWEEFKFEVPWGFVAGKWYGDRDQQPVLAFHGWQVNSIP